MRIYIRFHGGPKEGVASSYLSKTKKDFKEEAMLEVYLQR